MEKFSSEAKEYIMEKLEKLEWSWEEKANALRSEVKEKFWSIIVSGEALRKLVSRIRELQGKVKELNDSIPTKERYTVVDGSYHIQTKHGVIRITVEQADEMFTAYTKHWENLSWEAMLERFQMKPEAFQAIKSALRLYKDSHVVSPHSIQDKPEEEVEQIIEDAIGSHIDGIKRKMVVTHERKFKEEAKKAIWKLANIDYFLEHLREYLEDYTPEPIEFKEIVPSNSMVKHVIITDIHIWKINTNEVLERLNRIRDDIINSEEWIIHITCLGDIVENLAQDGMHPWQVSYWMDKDFGFWFDLMMKSVQIFEKFLSDIHNSGKKIVFYGVTWNHWRFTEKKENDINRTGELVIYELIKRGIQNAEIEFNYTREKISTIEYWRLHFIVAHWDDGFANRKQEDVLWKHGNNTKHNVVLLWDRHNVSVRETKWATWIQLPALAGKWQFDTQIDVYSEPWYVVVTENEFNTADVELKRLK